jgi:hypothetical protein
MAKELFKRVGEDQRFNELYTKLLVSKKLIQVVDRDLNDDVRYSTKGYVEAEQAALASVDRLVARNEHKLSKLIIEESLAKHDLSSEQEEVARKVLSGGDIVAVLGKAGTGKTRSLKAVVEAYQRAGYRVLGSALTGVAAEKLSKDLGIDSRTIDSWSYCWKYHGEDSPVHLRKKDILIVDEAGMNDTRMYASLLEKLESAGVKSIHLGDNDQVKPIGLGQFFRAVIDKVPTGVLKEVWRQKSSKVWSGQDKLISQFADGRVKEVLQVLDDNGRVAFGETKQGAIDKAVQSFMSDYRAEKYKSNVVIAFTKSDVDRINQDIRASLKREGLIEKGAIVATSRGKYEFSKGDRIMLLENENVDLKIKNGMFAKVESFSMGKMKIRLENDGRIVEFNTQDYNAFMHGYAVNTNKMQAETIEKTYFVGGKFDDFHKTYVSLSRHSEDLEIYLSRDEFKDLNAYGTKLYKEIDNTLIRDYEIGSHNQDYVDRVRSYKKHVEFVARDFGEIFQWAKEENRHVYEHLGWKYFCDRKNKRNALAKEIANDWRTHRLYANELGLRKENIFVHAGFNGFQKTELDFQREAIVKDAREHKDPMVRASAAFQVASQKASFGKVVNVRSEWAEFERVAQHFSKAALAKHDKGIELSLSERFAVVGQLHGKAREVFATELLGNVSEFLREQRHTEEYLRTENQKLVRWKEEKTSLDYKIESLERYLSKVYKDVPEALKRWHAVENNQGRDVAKKLLVKRPEALGELQGRSYFMLRDKVRAKASRLLKGVAKRFDSHEMYQRQSYNVAKEIKRVEEGGRYQSAIIRSEELKEILGIFKYGEIDQLKCIASKVVTEKDRITDKARLELLMEEDKKVSSIERELHIAKMNVETEKLNIERSEKLIQKEKDDMIFFVRRGYVNPEPILEKLSVSNSIKIEKLLEAKLLPDQKFGLTLNTSKKSEKVKQALLNILGKIRRYEGDSTQAKKELIRAQKKVQGLDEKLKEAAVLYKDKQARIQEIVRLRGDKKAGRTLGIKI